MDPIINLLDGLEPLGIMLTVMAIYLVLQFLVGIRTGGIDAELFEGSEAATQSENLITDGGSNGGRPLGAGRVLGNRAPHARPVEQLAHEAIQKAHPVADDNR